MDLIRRLIPLILQYLGKILSLSRRPLPLAQVEESVQGATQWFACRVLECLLESYDDQLSRERDSHRWRMVNHKTRSVLTSMGEIRLKRRYYRDQQTGNRVYLLDQALGLPSRQRVSDRLREQMVELATEMSYHGATRVLQGWIPDISVMTLWKEVQRIGEYERKRAEESQHLVFDRGEIPRGDRQVEELAVEADGVWLPARRNKEGDPRHIEVKLGVAYEGRSKNGRLKGRKVVAGVLPAKDFWEQTVAVWGQTWDWSRVRRCWLGSDGAGWLKDGVEVLPHAVYRLDRFHLRKALIEGLGSDSQGYTQVAEAIAEGDWLKTQKGLQEAMKRARGPKQKRIQALEKYLENNWAGIVKLPEAWRLGAIEGQVFHHVARRMKRQGARWSVQGADHLVRLSALKASGEWHRLAQRIQIPRATDLERRITRQWTQSVAQAAGDWLNTHLPALNSSFAGRPWVKYVLRQMVRAGQGLC